MHSHHRGRGKILFEVLCALSLAASLAGAWDQTGSSALLASASIMGVVSIYWSFGLFARRRVDDAAQRTAAVANAREAEAETVVQQEVFACQPDVPTEAEPVVQEEVFVREPDVPTEAEPVVQEEVFVREPDVPTEPEPVAAAPKPRKRPARKAKKAAADAVPVVERPEPVAIERPVSSAPPLEQLFDPVPFVRQPRPFGRKASGPRTLRAG